MNLAPDENFNIGLAKRNVANTINSAISAINFASGGSIIHLIARIKPGLTEISKQLESSNLDDCTFAELKRSTNGAELYERATELLSEASSIGLRY